MQEEWRCINQARSLHKPTTSRCLSYWSDAQTFTHHNLHNVITFGNISLNLCVTVSMHLQFKKCPWTKTYLLWWCTYWHGIWILQLINQIGKSERINNVYKHNDWTDEVAYSWPHSIKKQYQLQYGLVNLGLVKFHTFYSIFVFKSFLV